MFHVGASFISLAPTFFKSQSAFILLLLLSKSNPLGWASVWFWHNLQPLHLFCSYHSKKCDLFRRVAFSFGFRSRWSLHPSVIEMLGRSEFALRQGFACGKTLVRRKGAAGQKAGWMLLKKNCKRPERIWIVTPCQKRKTRRKSCLSFCVQSADVGTSNYDTPRIPCSGTETLKGIIMYNFESILSLGVFWYTAKDLDYTKK